MASLAVLISLTLTVRAQTFTPTASGNYDWSDPTVWSGAVPNSVGATVTLNNNTGASPRTIFVPGGVTIGSFTFNATTTRTSNINDDSLIGGDFNGNGVIDAADYVSLTKGGTLSNDPNPGNEYATWRGNFGDVAIADAPVGITFDAAGAGPATINVPAAASTGKQVFNTSMHLTDTLVATVNNTATSGFDGALRLLGTMDGPGGFTRLGSGSTGSALLNFEGAAKTYTGPTSISGGRTRMTAGAAPANSSSFTIDNDAELELSSDGDFQLGAGTLNLNGNLTGLGASGIIRPDRTASSGRFITILNPINLQSTALIHSQTQGATPLPTQGLGNGTSGRITFAGVISGGAGAKLQLSTPNHNEQLGVYYVQGNNTYSGGTELYGGKLVVGDEFGSYPNANLGTGNVTIYSGQAPFGTVVNGAARSYLEIDAGVTNAIANTATLALNGGSTPGVADDAYAYLASGVNEKVGGLVLGGVTQLVAGSYGSSTSGATFVNDEYFNGDGIITLAFPGSGSSLTSGSAVPEPATAALAGLLASLALIGGRRVRRRL
jgi:autotransporter-associated beta strand protein